MPPEFIFALFVLLGLMAVVIFVAAQRHSKARVQALTRQAMMFGFNWPIGPLAMMGGALCATAVAPFGAMRFVRST